MEDEKRKGVLSSISEDVAQLLTEECVALGKRKLYDQLFTAAEWCRWRYAHTAPETVEEFATDPDRGTLVAGRMPDYASKSALVDFFRTELEEDLERCRKVLAEHGEADDGE